MGVKSWLNLVGFLCFLVGYGLSWHACSGFATLAAGLRHVIYKEMDKGRIKNMFEPHTKEIYIC